MAGNRGSGRPNTIKLHPERKTIIKQIVLGEHGLPGGMSKAAVARRIGLSPETITRYRKDHVTEETVRAILAEARVDKAETDTAVLNDERVDVARTYESLAKRVEKLITKAEENEDDGFALAAMEGLRKVLRDIAQMHGRMSTNLTVTQSLATSPEWVTLKAVLRAVCEEVPEAREPLLKHMRHHVLSVTKEGDVL